MALGQYNGIRVEGPVNELFGVPDGLEVGDEVVITVPRPTGPPTETGDNGSQNVALWRNIGDTIINISRGPQQFQATATDVIFGQFQGYTQVTPDQVFIEFIIQPPEPVMGESTIRGGVIRFDNSAADLIVDVEVLVDLESEGFR